MTKKYISIEHYGKGRAEIEAEMKEESNNSINIDYKMVYEQLVEQFISIGDQNKSLVRYIETLHNTINELKTMDKDLRDKVLESM